MVKAEDIIKTYNMFWQYPVITEKSFYLQNKNDSKYIGIPWAMIHDRLFKNNPRPNLNALFKILLPLTANDTNYYTCCQHIAFRRFIPIWKALKITTVYASHKKIGEDKIHGVTIKPCPLYAVNFEDSNKNSTFKNVDLLQHPRQTLYNFVGAYQPADYPSEIRPNIFKMSHPENCVVRNTGVWHFDKVVFDAKQNINGDLNESDKHKQQTDDYNKLLLNSRYSLAPSGSGPNSIRFWEALAVGSIPILLSDNLELPPHQLWDEAILRVKERDLETIPELLSKITEQEESVRRENCLKIYNDLKNNYKSGSKNAPYLNNKIIHYCDGTYYRGAIGGVARYDYQIKKAFPNRIFVQGPSQKQSLLQYLEQNPDAIVITDNHLACDIPNNIKTLLVHHGCAKTTADRNPDWGEPYRSLCTNGQAKMLRYRDPNTTTIISISKACTDDFTNYYGKDYTKFNRITMLHPSEYPESKFKKTFNKNPIVLGNWNGLKKGEKLLPHLVKNIPNFKFQQLKCYLDRNNLNEEGIQDFNRRKQEIYLNSDIFLQISNSEGNSYATLDALICGIPLVSSNVGLFYGDVPEDCYVKLEWEKNGDPEYVEERLRYAWEHREELSRNARKWYMENCRFEDWITKMRKIVIE